MPAAEAGARLRAARGLLDGAGIDCLMVSDPRNRRYLSGFAGSSGYLFITGGGAVLATDFRYVEQAADQAPDYDVRRIGGGFGWLAELLGDLGASRLGVESEDLTVAALARIRDALASADSEPPEVVATGGLIDGIRQVKDSAELGFIQRASEIADGALEAVAPNVVPGMTEAAVAWELERTMREMGAESLSFDIIVGAGENGALPHHRAGGREIRRGDPVVIDMGCIYEGYCSDLTRTIFVGEPDERFRRVYNTVLCAQLRAEEGITSGMTGEEADELARAVIREAGYGEEFGHSLGHGVGLAVHEMPWVSPRAGNVLADGMVFTVEPGIYISGWGGVRIEDMVVLEEGRVRVLSAATKLEL